MQRLVHLALGRAGYEVIATEDGLAGLDLVRSLHPDLVILDVLLPGVNGFAVCEQLKRDPDVRSIPVLMLTAVYVTELDRQRGLKIGAEEYLLKADMALPKPVDLRHLVAAVQRLLGEESIQPPEANRILVVEDSPLQADLLRRLLHLEGRPTDFAATGEEGLRRFDAERHLAVLCDIKLPGISGLQVLQTLRAREVDAAIILITADGSEDDAAQACREGADDYVVKPVSRRALASSLERSIARARLRAERRALVAQLKQSNVELMRRYTESEARREELERLVAELRRTQEELVAAQRSAAISETAVAINHEINNPLAAIAGNVYLLLREGKIADERSLKRIRAIERQCERIQRTTQKLTHLCEPVVRQYVEGVPMLDLNASSVPPGEPPSAP